MAEVRRGVAGLELAALFRSNRPASEAPLPWCADTMKLMLIFISVFLLAGAAEAAGKKQCNKECKKKYQKCRKTCREPPSPSPSPPPPSPPPPSPPLPPSPQPKDCNGLIDTGSESKCKNIDRCTNAKHLKKCEETCCKVSSPTSPSPSPPSTPPPASPPCEDRYSDETCGLVQADDDCHMEVFQENCRLTCKVCFTPPSSPPLPSPSPPPPSLPPLPPLPPPP